MEPTIHLHSALIEMMSSFMGHFQTGLSVYLLSKPASEHVHAFVYISGLRALANGQSGGSVARRLGQHWRDILNKDVTKVVARHFIYTGSGVEDLIFTPIEIIKSKNPWVRLLREREFLNVNNLVADGLNINL